MNIKMNRIMFRLLAVFLSFTLFLSGCGFSKEYEAASKSGFYFDTFITLTIYNIGSDSTRILDQAFSLCETYEHLFSRTLEGSDINRINHASSSPVVVSDETIDLLDTALYYAELSGGKIDPTIAPVKDLWNFDNKEQAALPDQSQLKAACSHVDYHNIIIDKDAHTVTLSDPDAGLDLGFIAKGYIADKLKEYLLSEGVAHAIIDLGGNILCVGTKPDNTAFRVGIRYPFKDTADMITSLSCVDQSIVTSGIYERYFELDGTIYHHILDPETGYPIQNNLLSVTILSETSVEGDALSTLCYILGLSDGMALIESLDHTEAIFITDDGSLHYSSGLSGN